MRWIHLLEFTHILYMYVYAYIYMEVERDRHSSVVVSMHVYPFICLQYSISIYILYIHNKVSHDDNIHAA